MASQCSSERKSQTFITLNQKLAMIRLSEGDRQKARPPAPNSQPSCKYKGKARVGNANAAPVNTGTIRKCSNLTAD